MKIIGLDVGEKRIGVARADSQTRIAIPVGYIVVDGSEWQKIAKMAQIHGTNWFVLGLPRSNEGNETKQSEYVRHFAEILKKQIPGARIRFQDESLTSVMAEERLKGRRKPYEKGDIDAEAAAIILQDFMEQFQGTMAARVAPSTRPSITVETNPAPLDKKPLDNEKPSPSRKKWAFFAIPVLVLLIIISGIMGVNIWRDKQARERAEYYAKLEAEMQAEVFNFTILPGETIFSIQKKLAEQGYSWEEINTAFNKNYDFWFLAERPEGATLEGYLYGETHEFYNTATVEEILTQFLSGMDDVITENRLLERYAALGLTLHEGITLASVVQKEAAPRDQAAVARVFLNRMAAGMGLGSDVTVSYALDIIDPDRVTYSDNQAALSVDSCYNTRIYAGLPCGPISNPSRSALLAVAEPDDNNYLYFLTGDDGMMYYGSTWEEHERNREKCADLCNVAL